MNIWKSPVLYFGIFLVMLVGAALLAPYVVDWNRYRSDLEAYGTKLTGRQVEISGPIAVRLFPWPRLSADHVKVGNPLGAKTDESDQPLVQADRVVVRLTLGALLNGSVQVEGIDIEKPVLTLERYGDGTVNWFFSPTQDVRGSGLLANVRLDQIKITGGTIIFDDHVREVKNTLTQVEATLAAPNLRGPWRSGGSFLSQGNRVGFTLNTLAYESGKPLNLSARLNYLEKSGLSLAFEGTLDPSKGAEGTMLLQPQAGADGRTDLESALNPLVLKAKVQADFSQASLSEIDIRSSDPAEQGTVITGQASFAMAHKITADVTLTSPRINLDAQVSSPPVAGLQGGKGLALINGWLQRLPDMDIKAALKIAALTAGGAVIENIDLQAGMSREALRIHKLTSTLPGRSQMQFNGALFAGVDYAELGGDLTLDSNDFRALVQWLMPSASPRLTEIWTGSRGHFKGQGAVNLSASRLELRAVQYELDGQTGHANFSLLVNGARPIMTLWLDMAKLDLDQFMPQGLGLFGQGPAAGWQALLLASMAKQPGQDMKLTLQAGALHLNGVEAQDVTFDVETSALGFDIKSIEVGSVGGAKLTAAGTVLSKPEGLDGQIGVKITADAPYELLRLAGFLPHETAAGLVPQRLSVLGKTDLALTLTASPTAGATTLGLSAEGGSGALAVRATGSLVPLGKGLVLNGHAGVTAESSAALAVLLGLRPALAAEAVVDQMPASLALTLDGMVGGGFKTELTGKLYQTDYHYAGQLDLAQPFLGANGALVLQASDGASLIAALHVPRLALPNPERPGPEPVSGPLSFTTAINSGPHGLQFSNIQGQLGEISLTGQALLATPQRLKAELAVNKATLKAILLQSFLPWAENSTSLDQLFAERLPGGFEGEIWLTPAQLELYPGYSVRDSQLVLSAHDDLLEFDAYGKQADGTKVSLALKGFFAGTSPKFSGEASIPFDLATDLKLVSGEAPFAGSARIEASFAGNGRSPAAVLAGLSGQGSFTLSQGLIRNLDPQGFSQALPGVKDQSALEAAFIALHHGAGMVIGETLSTLTINSGVVAIAPFGGSTADADLMIKPVIDLNDMSVDIGLQLTLKAAADLPAMVMKYFGAPQALQLSEDRSALASALGFKVLNRGVEELEKLQAEQQKIAADEAKMQAEDRAKLELYNAQRAELRLRQRELRIQGEQRVREDEARQKAIEAQAAEARRLKQTATPKPQPAVPAQGPVILVPPATPPLAIPPSGPVQLVPPGSPY